MPLMFLLTGLSSYLSLQKRQWREYLRERFLKLFFPLLFGVLLIVPVQTYYAEKFHNNYEGGYLQQYKLFFTKATDLTGYNGGFTPGHLWFLLYLLIIALLALPLMLKLKSSSGGAISFFNNPVKLIFLFIIPFIFSPILDIAGKSLGQFTALVVIGFLMCKQNQILDTIEKYKWLYGILALSLFLVSYYIYYTEGWPSGFNTIAIAFTALRHLIMWVSILAILGYGKRYLNFSNKITAYLTRASFPLYIFHQTWLVFIAYYVFKVTDIFIVQFVSIMLLTFLASILTYELFKRIPVIRFMFGIK